MKRPHDEISKRYSETQDSFLAEISEVEREAAYELGRSAIEKKIGLLEIVEIYRKTIDDLLAQISPHAKKTAVAAGELLSAVLAPFEMTHRGYQESATALQKLNSELRFQAAELVALNKEFEAFSYSVSHDLRAPLRRILGFSRIILEDHSAQLDELAHGHMRRIIEGCQRMDQLIEGMLALSKLTRKELVLEAVDLSELVRKAGQELRDTAPNRKVAFQIAEGIFANGDRTLLQAVIMNLVSNAWKFTMRQPEAYIEFGSHQEDGKQVYFLKDNGAGFDMQYADKLFGVFQRLHPVEEFEGTGVGLATVRRIIERHGGKIWANGQINNGATFFFTLL